MKLGIQLLSIFSFCIGIYIFLQSELNYDKRLPIDNSTFNSRSTPDDSFLTTPLCLVYFQDVSKSIKLNGVVLIKSNVFTPYYNDFNRDIELNFGIISDLSANKLLSVILPAKKFHKPVLPDLRKVNIVERKDAKQRFLTDLKTYQSDSAAFFYERNKLFTSFCYQIDSSIAVHRNNLANETDIATTVRIADKVFNHSFFDSAKNFLLLNSDGEDSYGKTTSNIQSHMELILINASGLEHTSLDSLITHTFQSSEQAIHYTLKTNSH
ncbi:MAG: hypothetical protein IPG01_13360 [Chitinophagaceae bacterium]|nr:hypothetical protein [Chitinophagaceae bacterium]